MYYKTGLAQIFKYRFHIEQFFLMITANTINFHETNTKINKGVLFFFRKLVICLLFMFQNHPT